MWDTDTCVGKFVWFSFYIMMPFCDWCSDWILIMKWKDANNTFWALATFGFVATTTMLPFVIVVIVTCVIAPIAYIFDVCCMKTYDEVFEDLQEDIDNFEESASKTGERLLYAFCWSLLASFGLSYCVLSS